MLWPLDVLVVDDALDSVRFLTEFLNQRCRRVDCAATAQAAMAAAVRRRAMHEPYQVVFLDFVLGDLDGLALLQEMRSHQDDLSFIFVTSYRLLNPGFEAQAHQLGALDILDKPVDLKRVEALLSQTSRFHRRKEAEKTGDQPFFGTARLARGTAPAPPASPDPPAGLAALEPRKPPAGPTTGNFYRTSPDVAGGAALEPRQYRTPQPQVPQTGHQQRPSGIIASTGSTARVRRGVTPMSGGLTPPPVPGTPPQTGMTTRVRRGITDSYTAGVQPESGMRLVACPTCGKPFNVPRKADVFTIVCVHCGQLQRVEPG